MQSKGLSRVFYNIFEGHIQNEGFPGGSDGKVSACNAGDPGSIPGLGRCLEKEMQPTPVLLPVKYYGQRSLMVYKELDTTQRLNNNTKCYLKTKTTFWSGKIVN